MRALCLAVAATLLLAAPATAGPPYDTDDPEPTDLHHWELYAFAAADRGDGDIDGAAGLDVNYGALPGVQLTATLPVGFTRERGERLRGGAGDVELGVKYRFLDRAKSGWQAAIFPRLIAPTARRGFGERRVRLLLPLWVQKDIGDTSIFGGGGYEFNPGPGNRNFWQAGFAVTRAVGKRLSLGAEIVHQSPDSDAAAASTALGLGAIRKLGGPFALLFSAGPTFTAGRSGSHAYLALGMAF